MTKKMKKESDTDSVKLFELVEKRIDEILKEQRVEKAQGQAQTTRPVARLRRRTRRSR